MSAGSIPGPLYFFRNYKNNNNNEIIILFIKCMCNINDDNNIHRKFLKGVE